MRRYHLAGSLQKFTLKERDIETGLDYFLARYYSSTQGRFTSGDPLLSSGRTELPQSWNRYSYVLNNPLAFTDPFGLYEAKNLTDDQIALLEKAIKISEDLRNRYDVGSAEYNRINDALKALGHNGDGNGVVVTVGGDDPGGAITEVTDKGITVTFGRNLLDARRDIKEAQVVSDLTGAIAHEGSHVAKGQEWRKSGKSPTTFEVEVLAYTTQVDMHKQFNSMMREQRKGPYEMEMSHGDREGSKTVIYSPGWSEVDVRTAIGTFLERSPKYRLTPQSKDLAFPTKKKRR